MSIRVGDDSLRQDLLLNVGSQLLLRIVTALTALYAARVLGPAQFGVWAVLQVVFMYTAQGHFGTVNAMMRDVPLALARHDHATAARLVSSTWSFVTLASVPVATVCAGALYLWHVPGISTWALVIVGSVWLVIVQLQSVFFQFYCRAYSCFRLLAAVSTTQAVLTIPLCVWLIPKRGIAGYLFALSAGFTLVAIAVFSRPDLKLVPSMSDWRYLLLLGLPMLPGTLMLYLNVSLERVVLASSVSATAVGMFAAGAFFFQTGGTVWELIVYTLYSRLARAYGQSDGIESLVEAFRDMVPGAVWVSSLGQGFAFVVFPFALKHLLPSYSQSIAVAQVMILAVNVWGIAQLLALSLTIIGRQKQSAVLQGGFLAVKLLLILLAAVLFKNATSVAIASVFALLLYFGSVLLLWERIVGTKLFSLPGTIALWGFPAIAAVLCAWGASNCRETVVRSVVFLAIASIATVAIHSRSGIFRRLYVWSAEQ